MGTVQHLIEKVGAVVSRICNEGDLLPGRRPQLRRRMAEWQEEIARLRPHGFPLLHLLPLLYDIHLALVWCEVLISALQIGQKAIGPLPNDGRRLPMHHRNVEAAGQETLRLLRYTDEVLSEHIKTPDLVRDADPEQMRQLDRTKVLQWRRVLQNETEKVKNLETVIAIVGAVKAGKSTTINAIVGADILPNRSDPMTTFPTLVRHVPGRIDPRLRFPLAAEFQDLAIKVKARLSVLAKEKPLLELFRDHTERIAAESVLDGGFDTVEEVYEGRESASRFLERINDFCRLVGSKPMSEPGQLELPDPESDNVTRLPVIEIEFHHIVANMSSVGQLTILDSPGPNEAGQGERLRRIIQEQLRQASAVVLVCNCTENKTEASDELQKLVTKFLSEFKDRLFVFVNKIDQLTFKDRQDSIREDYSRLILGGEVQPERIFPVAARNAFLANWGLRELKNHGRLPDPAANPMTGDFGMQAVGTLWRRKIDNIEDVRLSALELWELSRFTEPLKDVIQVAADNAALMSLKAASAKVLICNRVLDSFLGLRQSVATRDVESIQQHIKELELDIDGIRSAREAIDHEMKALVEEFNEGMNELCNVISKDVEETLNHYFEKGKVEEAEDLKQRRQSRRDTVTARMRKRLIRLGDLLGSIFAPSSAPSDSSQQSVSSASEVGPLKGERTFRGSYHKRDADIFVGNINDEICGIFDSAHTNMKKIVDRASSALANSVVDEVNNRMSPILERAKERLERVFDVTFAPPTVELKGSGSLKVDIRGGTVTSATEYNTRYVERAGEIAKVKRWFADLFDEKWGYDQVTESADVSKVDLSALRGRAQRQLGGFETAVEYDAKTFVERDLQPAINAHFTNLAAYLEEFRGDLLDALQDTELEAGRLDALKTRISELRLEVEDLLMDAQALAQGLEAV
jgi:GTPase SAR1 family protein